MAEQLPDKVNTPNPFVSFLQEINFYKKNYPVQENDIGLTDLVGSFYAGNLEETYAQLNSNLENAKKYVLYNSSVMGKAFGFSSLMNMNIKESMFTPYISGTLDFYDENDLVDVINFTGNETIEIIFGLGIGDQLTLKFRVISAKLINDYSSSPRINEIEKTAIYRIEFISEEIFNNTFVNSLLKGERDFIGYIAIPQDERPSSESLKGLVNQIATNLNLYPIEIEETKNGIWLKHNEISYPSGKEQGQNAFANLMQQICTYAVSRENPNAVNFFFWRDRFGWKFKSLEKMIKDSLEKNALAQAVSIAASTFGLPDPELDGKIQEYFLNTDDEASPYKVWSVTSLNSLDTIKLYSNKAFSSFYKSWKPNFSDPYYTFLDTSDGFTGGYIDYNYHRDFNKIKHIEENKLIAENVPSSPFLAEDLPIPSYRLGDDSVYGYYDTMRYNNPYGQWIYNSADMGFGMKVDDPAVVWWDYLGRSGDSRWSNSIWQPQFDMTDLDIKVLHTIENKIRKPLREKRQKFAELKNIKRKWEVYRCAVCCLEGSFVGGTVDAALYQEFQGSTGATFSILFGPTGIFSEMGQEYKLVSAGSFTDIINYSSGDTASQNGLTYSYDLTKEPYNQTIGQFYNFKEEIPNYQKYIFERGLNTYTYAIEQTQKRIDNLDSLINNADGYIASLDGWISTHLEPCPEPKNPPPLSKGYPGFGLVNYGFGGQAAGGNIFSNCGGNKTPVDNDTPYPNGGAIPSLCIPEGLCWKIYQFNCPSGPNYEPLPSFIKNCSIEPAIAGPITVLNNYLTLIDGYYYRYYNLSGGYYEWTYPWQRKNYIEGNNDQEEIQKCLEAGDCYNNTCFNPIAIEVQKRIAINEKKALLAQLSLLQYTKDIVENQFIPKWISQYQEWNNRKSFFFSKTPGTSIFTGITGGRKEKLNQPLSLYNVKNVTRKEIRGSRYELLARAKGITGASAGEWVYNIFFGNDDEIDPFEKHPYYDQGYSDKNGKGSFISQRNAFYQYTYQDANGTNNPPFNSQFVCTEKDPQSYTEKSYLSLPNNIVEGRPGFTNKGLIAQDLKTLNGYSDEGFRETFNIFEDDLLEKKPPNIKKEEISSYVRIEFQTPIGLDRIADFPNGFVRDAGSEYFLPYLVQITPGPNGRQTIRNNIAIIGMDPYGFDVAIKKQKIDEEQKSRDYWWYDYFKVSNTGLSDNSMDLWPEFGFETARPYYTIDPRTYWTYLDEYYGNYNYYDYWDYTPSFQWWTNSGVDPEYKMSSHGSNYIQTSHKKVKPHRSWWSFSFPKNIFIPQRFFGLLSEQYGGWYEGYYSGSLFSYGFWQYRWWYGDEFERWIRLENNQDTIELLNQSGIDTNSYIGISQEDGFAEVMDVYSENSVEELHPDIKRYFGQATLHWLHSDYNLYRPGLLATDVWKYDLSGESDYGLISPPTSDPNYDLFDNNFAAQFVVFARSTEGVCEKFTCANPNGTVSSSGCPEDDPYCNCPAQDRIPTEREPSYLELYRLYQELRECDLIEKELGKDYLGCMWIDPNNPCSCNCPEVGKKYGEYLEYTKTYATYWDTPKYTPLFRNAQISQFMSQQISIVVAPNKNIKVGDLIKLNHNSVDPLGLGLVQQKKLSGYWMIVEINHRFDGESAQMMQIVLNRDTLPIKPNI